MIKVYYKNSAGSVIDLAGKNYKMHKATDLLSYRWQWINSEYINKIESFSMEYAEKTITVSIMASNREEYIKALDTISDAFEYDVKMLSPGKLYVGDYYLSCYIISADQEQFNPHRLRTNKIYGILAESGQWMKETEYDLSVLTQMEDESDLFLKTAHITGYPVNLLVPPKYVEASGQGTTTQYVSAAPNIEKLLLYGITKKEGDNLRCMERAVMNIMETGTGKIDMSQNVICRLHGLPAEVGNCTIDGVEYLSDEYNCAGEVHRYYKEITLNGSEEWSINYVYDAENGSVSNAYFYLNLEDVLATTAMCDQYEYTSEFKASMSESFTAVTGQLRFTMDEYAGGATPPTGEKWSLDECYEQTVPLFKATLAAAPIKVVYRVEEYVEKTEAATITLPLAEAKFNVEAYDQTGILAISSFYMRYKIRAVSCATYVRNKITPEATGDIWVGTVEMEPDTAYQIVASTEGIAFKVETPEGAVEEVENLYYTATERGVYKIIASLTELQEFYVVVNTGESYEGYPPNDYKIRAAKVGKVVMEQVASDEGEMYMHGDFDTIESDYEVVYELSDYLTSSALDYPYDYTYDLVSARISKHVINHNVVAADFILIVFGPCVNPAVYINGHLYQVNVTLYTGEYLEINSKRKRIYKVKVDGERINCFYQRNRESYIFEKIRPGKQAVLKDGFGIKLTILEERSEARWWS